MKEFFKKLLNQVQKFDSDTKHYEKNSKIPSIPAEACVNMGLYWAGLGNYEKAKSEFDKSTVMACPSPDGFINIGIYHARNGQYDDAQAAFRNALRLDRFNARAYSLWASVLVEIGEYSDADKFYKKANKRCSFFI